MPRSRSIIDAMVTGQKKFDVAVGDRVMLPPNEETGAGSEKGTVMNIQPHSDSVIVRVDNEFIVDPLSDDGLRETTIDHLTKIPHESNDPGEIEPKAPLGHG